MRLTRAVRNQCFPSGLAQAVTVVVQSASIAQDARGKAVLVDEVSLANPASTLIGEKVFSVLASTAGRQFWQYNRADVVLTIQSTPWEKTVTLPEISRDKAYLKRALDVTINLGLVVLLVVTCFLILRPFVPLISWGIIIAVATYPGFLKLQRLLRGHGGAAAALCTIAYLVILIAPAVLLTDSLLQGIQSVSARLKGGGLLIPPPPQTVAAWPLVGPPLSGIWALASSDLSKAIEKLAPELKAAVPGLISASAGLGLTVLQLFFSILISGALLAKAEAAARVTRLLSNRLFGEKGPEYQQLIGRTIRSVTFGILGVALIQSVFAAAGFLAVGLPGAGFWIVTFLFAAVLQVGGLVLVPAVIYVFAISSTTKAVIFLLWCIIVGLMDNVLKPILLGRGSTVPIVVIFLGAIGGFMGMGILGLFIGAIVLSVGYKLFLAWLGEDTTVAVASQP